MAISWDDGSTAQEALQLFAELTKDFPRLDATNLHAYRKCLRKILHVAEISADAQSKQLAAAFRKIVNAAGEWHDWQQLTEEARRLSARREQSEGSEGLTPMLESMAVKAWSKAVALSRRLAKRLLKDEG